MNLTRKHTIKTIILWIGIVTAVLLIISSFLQLNYSGVGFEMNGTMLNQDHLQGLVTLIQEISTVVQTLGH